MMFRKLQKRIWSAWYKEESEKSVEREVEMTGVTLELTGEHTRKGGVKDGF